ncbi:hypothetical protein A2634_03470 [Candidatus Amesbacteria bacterium RIFCSPHIGHO2_01_FULL_48_32]|uniref:Sortase n=1 Tax=Candidatus Amesbacteria bacterium RIFCSPLOWO2_01_FULL_48_25 TaxID=1797259 RepID=A0A1F4ZEH1_9BACT|nr:MAG: hypothetical protein A2634_03470 [Candidatus Amesbacteria bacterium RIFCSPHIGHO2_01_FULL_48_32]OGD04316.1 MAG: hypothetical protein A2989_04735 [Candidatus Amesbacteria bacterium RIFCSPLOWO2_01_FULL_48_25]
MKSGVVYGKGAVGVVDIGKRVTVLKNVGRGLKAVGIVMVGYGVIAMIVIFGPLAKEEFRYFVNPKPQVTSLSEIPIIKSQVPKWEVPDENFSVYIPKIGAVSKVIENVDAGSEKEYLTALKLGVAQAKGLAHPGEKGTTFLFAHSAQPIDFARYNAVFYLLDRLILGDEVQLVYKGKLFIYKVSSVQRLASSDTRYLKPQDEEEILVLQTCWPPGTAWKRLVLTARRVMIY